MVLASSLNPRQYKRRAFSFLCSAIFLVLPRLRFWSLRAQGPQSVQACTAWPRL